MLDKEFVDELPDWSFLRFWDELVVFPLVAEGRLAAERLSHLCTNRNGRRNALGDFLPLPLRHRGDHGVEQPPGRSRRVDRLGERDQIGVVLTEVVRELE